MHALNVEGEGGFIVDIVELSLPTDGTRVTTMVRSTLDGICSRKCIDYTLTRQQDSAVVSLHLGLQGCGSFC